jgi:hypothetical protein
MAIGLLAFGAAAASQDSLVTAVFSSARRDYVRPKLPDGSFQVETYVVGNGGYGPGVGLNPSIDAVPFPVIVRQMATYLARRNYFPARDANAADLLLVISWGTTHPFGDGTYRNGLDGLSTAMNLVNGLNLKQSQADKVSGPGAGAGGVNPAVMAAANDAAESQLLQMQMFENMRNQADESNARLLGYMSEINRTNGLTRYAGGGTYFDDLISDVENERYYVIISAYDYKLAAREKKRKLLWSTRVSIQAQGNRFDRSVAAMLAAASHQFGANSNGLIRRYHEGVVNLGELKIIGVEPEPTPPETPAKKN